MSATHLFVNLFCELLAVVACFGDLPSKEHRILAVSEGPRSEYFAHPPSRDHRACEYRRLLDVVRWTRRRFTELKLFGRVAAQSRAELVAEHRGRSKVRLLIWQESSVSARHAVRDDGHLLRRIVMLHEVRDDCMSALVVRHQPLLLRCHYAALALRAGD